MTLVPNEAVVSHAANSRLSDFEAIQANCSRFGTEWGSVSVQDYIEEEVGTSDEFHLFNSDYSGWVIPRLAAGLFYIACSDMRILQRNNQGVGPVKQLIDEFILPQLQLPKERPVMRALLGEKTVDACSAAESLFDDALQQAITGDDNYQSKISVYHDRQLRPLAFRKKIDSSSALTLVPLEMDGIHLPAGTIVGVISDNVQQTGHMSREHDDLYTYLVKDAISIDPARLSSWAFKSPLDRSTYATHVGVDGTLKVDEQYKDLLCEKSLDDFKAAALHVMRICGVCTE